jgi:hypothetical protein
MTTQAQADLQALEQEFDGRKKDQQKSIDLDNKELETAKANQAAAKADYDKACAAADAAHQAWLDTLPKDPAQAKAGADKPADAKAADKPAAKDQAAAAADNDK